MAALSRRGSRTGPSGSRLLARSFGVREGELSEVVEICAGVARPEYPAIVAAGERALLTWQAKPHGCNRYAVFGVFLSAYGVPSGEPRVMAEDDACDCRKPAVAASPHGDQFAIAFERYERGVGSEVGLATVDSVGVQADETVTLTDHPAGEIMRRRSRTDRAVSGCGWRGTAIGAATISGTFTPWYQLVGWELSGRRKVLVSPEAGEQAQVGGTEIDVAVLQSGLDAEGSNERGTMQGFELVRLAVSPRGVVCVLGRASHNFYLQHYSKEGRSALYRLPQDGWGGRGRLLRGVFDGQGSLWVTRRDLSGNVLERVSGFEELPRAAVSNLVGGRRLSRRGPPERELTGRTKRYTWPCAARGCAGIAGLLWRPSRAFVAERRHG